MSHSDLVSVATADVTEDPGDSTRFLADFAHELRNPLTVLASAVAIINSRRDDLPEWAIYAVDVLDAQVEAFNRLALDLLELSRIEAGAGDLEIECIELAPFVSAVLDQRGEQVPTRLLAGASRIHADPRRLLQIFTNLLDNARDHAGGATLILSEPTQSGARLVVEDQGPGVAEADRSRVFDRFWRATGSPGRSTRRGNGLGLALVADHVRLHQGHVHVETQTGGGARFVVELPHRSLT